MMGIYPVMPGVPVYDVASPVFTRVTIHLKNGKEFVIAAPASSRDNKYVQSARWNGKALTTSGSRTPMWSTAAPSN